MVAQDTKYGLEFNSFETIQEKRTGLNLTPSKPFSFSNGFSLSFDICFPSNSGFSYGYVFRIIGQNEHHIDFLLNESAIIVTHSLDKTIAVFSFNDINYTHNNYFHFVIGFDIENSTLNISLNDRKVSTKTVNMVNFKEVNIVFGKCNYSQFQATDVPKMLIKNIRINNHKGDSVYFWPLSKHTQNGVYDELKKQFAYAENPQWLLDRYVSWKQPVAFDAKRNPQICYNGDKNSVVVFDQMFMYSYDIHSCFLKKEKLEKGIPESFYTNQTLYTPLTHSYYSYFDVKDNILTYDTITNSWDSMDKERTNSFYWHHNKIISSFDSCLYIFGGYGHHKYNNAINKYDFKTRTWAELHFNGDKIQPRYLCGLGAMDENRIVIFGGYGSETGAQELSPENYYDLFMVDIKELTIKKIWELSPPKENFVVANSIVIDSLNKCFYALCFPHQLYNTSLFLGKFSLERPEYEILSNSIPLEFQDIHSYVDLFLDKATDELIAITSSPIIADSTTIVSFYSLSYPPLNEKDLYQSEKNDHPFGLWIIILLFILSLFVVVLCIISRRRKIQKETTLNSTMLLDLEMDYIDHIESTKTLKDKQAIHLFGAFRVIDKNGHNLTGEFSPLLKQLFLIILLNTLKDGKGISSLKLRETLWFDKTQESARNNRGVLLSRLRQIFKQIGIITIENKNSLWTIEFGDDVYCDYYEAIILIKRLRNEDNPNKKDIHELLLTVSAGGMLPNLQIDWIDSFKADFSNDLIDTLLHIMQHPGLKLSPPERIYLADAIFIHDFLNEDALKIKCKALIEMGKNGLAKGVYTSFEKGYHISFGSRFKYSFDQIIS
jgi:hypothetical protein